MQLAFVQRPGESHMALGGKKCIAFHRLFICLDHRLANSLSMFRRHSGLISIVSEAILVILCGLFWCLRPLFVLVPFFLCWRNANLAGRFACRRCCLVFVCRFFSMDLPRFLKANKGLHTILPLTVRTEP